MNSGVDKLFICPLAPCLSSAGVFWHFAQLTHFSKAPVSTADKVKTPHTLRLFL